MCSTGFSIPLLYKYKYYHLKNYQIRHLIFSFDKEQLQQRTFIDSLFLLSTLLQIANFRKFSMSILTPETSLTIEQNEGKQLFVSAQINRMIKTKIIYQQLQQKIKKIISNKLQYDKTNKNTSNSNKINTDQAQNLPIRKVMKEISSLINFLNDHISSQKSIINDQAKYSSNNLVTYLQQQIEQIQEFYPLITKSYYEYAKAYQKMTTNRQNQLQKIQNIKYINQQEKENLITKLQNQNNVKRTIRTISAFNVNKRILDILTKDITFLKLKQRKLQKHKEELDEFIDTMKRLLEKQQQELIENNEDQCSDHMEILREYQQSEQYSENIQNKKAFNVVTEDTYNNSHAHDQEKKRESMTSTRSSEFYKKPKSPTINQSPLKSKFLSQKGKQNESSSLKLSQGTLKKQIIMPAIEKATLIYHKDKFQNDQLQEKIRRMESKLISSVKVGEKFKQKNIVLQKRIEQLQWENVCDQTLVVKNRKLDSSSSKLDISVLDRTRFLRGNPRNMDSSLDMSKMSINQSIIKMK